MNHATYLLNMLVQTIIYVFFVNQLLKPKMSFQTITAIYFCPFIIVYAVSILAGDTDLDSPGNKISRYVLGIIFPFVFYSGKWFKKLSASVLFCSSDLLCEALALVIIYKIFGRVSQQELIDNHLVPAGQAILSDVLLLFIIIVAFVVNYRKFKLEKSLAELSYMLCFISLHFVFVIAYYYINRNNISEANNMVQLAFQTLLFIMIFIQYYNSLNTSRLRETEREYKAIQNRMENDYNYYMLADSKFTEISELRHDIQNQFRTIRVLLNTPDGREEAENIIDDIQQRLLSVKAVNYCKNRTINAVLTVKLNEEKTNRIQTQIVLNDCSGLPFDDYDLCSLISNLFDNAIESCMKFEDVSKTFIEIKSGIQGGFFIIKFTNSCLNEIEKGKSQKSEAGHGYGTKISANICQKYKGSFDLKKEGDTAIATAALSLEF